MREFAGLMLTDKALDDAAKAAYERRMGKGMNHPRLGMRTAKWEELSPEMRNEEKEAVLAAMTSAVASSNDAVRAAKVQPDMAGGGCGHMRPGGVTEIDIGKLLHQIFGLTDAKEDEDADDIIEYIAHSVSRGIPTDETYQKVASFYGHLRHIATIKLKGKDNAKLQKEDLTKGESYGAAKEEASTEEVRGKKAR